MNASPDLRAQIEAFPALQPQARPPRNSPIAGVLLTNADLDHVLGLFTLREGEPLNIYATGAVRDILTRSIGLDSILGAFCGVSWHEPPIADFAPLGGKGGGLDSLLYRSIPLPSVRPSFARGESKTGFSNAAFLFMDRRTGGQLLVAPDVPGINAGLLEALGRANAVLFDGTFWSREELRGVKSTAPAADEMGHLTIKDSSLNLLRGSPAEKKIYIHINNTNPILSAGSPERAAVEEAGLRVGADGLEFEL